MKVKLDILRRKNAVSEQYRQSIVFETQDENATVASALMQINADSYKDTDNKPVEPIQWECSCMQKKCGACAMLINSKPQLACNAKLRDFVKKGVVTVEPLKKFPVVADLIVDRSVMFSNLRTLNLWFNEKTKADESAGDIAYEASRCLQCGCCLEICPNFCAEGDFSGMSAIIPASRLISLLPDSQKEVIYKMYRKNMYEGCGKSLACRKVCPAGIEIDRLLVNSNAAAVWKRRIRHRKNTGV